MSLPCVTYSYVLGWSRKPALTLLSSEATVKRLKRVAANELEIGGGNLFLKARKWQAKALHRLGIFIDVAMASNLGSPRRLASRPSTRINISHGIRSR